MGKYNKLRDTVQGELTISDEIYLSIANELAEANRLKRIELKYTFVKHMDTISKELEDQA